MLTGFFETNKVLVDFGYPLIFFLMGFGIFLKNTRHSRFDLAKSLYYLGLFGILHGISDWGNVFIPIQQAYLSSGYIFVFNSIKISLNAISFYFLFYFGLSLILKTTNGNKRIIYIPLLLLMMWFAAFIFLQPFLVNTENVDWWFAISDIWARYLLAFPGGVISSIALYMQRGQFEKFGVPSMTRTLMLAVASVGVYTLAGGLIVPYAPMLPAILFNSDMFLKTIGIPVEFFRAISGFFMSFFVLRILSVFDLEYQHFFYAAEKQKVIMEERINIARDLHDGLVQSIYAAGLHLERVRNMLSKEYGASMDATDMELQGVVKKLNGIIREIREYIKQLKLPVSSQADLKEEVEKIWEEMNLPQSLHLDVEFTESDNYFWPLPQTIQISYILKEALSNILRHAEASEVKIKVEKNSDQLHLEVRDNGKGFDDVPAHEESAFLKQGIKNMKYRALTMGGVLSITSSLGMGTTIVLNVQSGRGYEHGESDRRSSR